MNDFIQSNLDYYEETQGILPSELEDFGEEYRAQGHLTRDQLYDIAYESSVRSAHHVERNSKSTCVEVTENVIELQGDDFSMMQLLTGLHGFKTPTASCVLAALNPSQHAVVDTRVWASLERKGYFEERKESFSTRDYVKMMRVIRDISSETDYTCTDVGYALFAYDDKVREGTLH